jgi:hypothetical protein
LRCVPNTERAVSLCHRAFHAYSSTLNFIILCVPDVALKTISESLSVHVADTRVPTQTLGLSWGVGTRHYWPTQTLSLSWDVGTRHY